MCAVSILDKLAEFNLNKESDGEKGLNLRFGLHYGSVLFGNTGSEDSLEFTVIGDAISGASRLETYAKDLKKTLLASKELISEIQNIASLPIKMSSVGNLPSKNKSKPIEVFSIEKKP
nr:adenylate/guanylate cyclase domain-containing protein [Leptospira sp.]